MKNNIFQFLKEGKYRQLIIATVTIILIGTIVYHFIEGWSWLDSTYFSVITLATVGYGDLSPQTSVGKIFTIFFVLFGVGLMFSFINTFYQYRLNKKDEN